MNIYGDTLMLMASFMACVTFWNLRDQPKTVLEKFFVTCLGCFAAAFTATNIITAIVHIVQGAR